MEAVPGVLRTLSGLFTSLWLGHNPLVTMPPLLSLARSGALLAQCLPVYSQQLSAAGFFSSCLFGHVASDTLFWHQNHKAQCL